MKKRVPEEKELKGDNDPQLIEDMLMKLKTSTETIGDLIAVSEEIQKESKQDYPKLHSAL